MALNPLFLADFQVKKRSNVKTDISLRESFMLRNIFGPLSGGIGQERVLEVLANNIANANTTAFKEDEVTFSSLAANPWPNYSNPLPPAPFKKDMSDVFPLHGNDMNYVAVSDVQTTFKQGSLQKTENPLDLAVEGEGFFSIQTPFGERFTRDGSFTLTPDGMLATKNGFIVQGENGAISGLKEGDVKILDSGEVYNGDKYIDKIKVTAFADNSLLQRLGSNLFVHDGPPDNIVVPMGRVSQGYLESSNVNPMKNMTSMIIAHRAYEALQKTIKAHDETMHLSSTKIGETQ